MKNRLLVGCFLTLAASTLVNAAGDCIKNQDGNVVCGKGQCATDQDSKVFCAKEGGGAMTDEYGKVRCGLGYCATDDMGKIRCSRKAGGGAMTIARSDVGNPTDGAHLTNTWTDVHGALGVEGNGEYYTAPADRAPDTDYGSDYVVAQTC